MRKTWTVVVALVCLVGCADVEPAASVGPYDDEPAARETALPEVADAGLVLAPDSATTAPDAAALVVVPVSPATAPDANVATAQAPDAGAATSSPATPDAAVPAVVVVPSSPVLTGVQAAYDGRPIRIRNITSTFDWVITIHAGANARGWPDAVDVVDMLTGKALTQGMGGLDNANTGTTDSSWAGYVAGWRLSLRFDRYGKLRESMVAERISTGDVLANGNEPQAYWAAR